MQIRKLVKSGHTSLVVAVPSDWIKKNKLKAGDMLYIKEDRDQLCISTDVKDQPREKCSTVINVDGKDSRRIMYEISAAYMDNFHLITLKGKELIKKSKDIKKYITNLVALELLEESSEKIVARSFLNVGEADPKAIIRRMDNIVRSMITDTKDVWGNPDLAECIVDRDKEVNRLNILIYKLMKYAYRHKDVTRLWGLDEMEIMRYWEVNICLEKIGDRIKNIAILVPQMKKHKKLALDILAKVETLYQEIMKSFYKNSFDHAADISSKRHDLVDEVQKNMIDNNCVICSQVGINFFIMIANINNISRAVRYLD
jgi:phosphate uptake regulator